jgi:hypothetical protein
MRVRRVRRSGNRNKAFFLALLGLAFLQRLDHTPERASAKLVFDPDLEFFTSVSICPYKENVNTPKT